MPRRTGRFVPFVSMRQMERCCGTSRSSNRTAPVPPPTIHQKNGHASPTPIVTDDGRLFVHFGHQGTACLDLAGTKLWQNRSLTYRPVHGNGGSPVLVDGKLIFNCDAESSPFIVALDAKTGEVAWRIDRPETAQPQKFAFATCAVIAVDGRTEVISPGAGAVDALDPGDGKHLWRVSYEGYSNVPKPVFAHGLIFITTSYDTPDMLAIDPRGASGDVTETHVKWTSGKKAPMTVSPIVVGEEIYWVTDQGGIVTCADAKSGRIHWAERIGARANSASPVFADGRIYLLDEDGKTHVLQPVARFANSPKTNWANPRSPVRFRSTVASSSAPKRNSGASEPR